ncbi:MAG: DNA polymerase III subunit alpha, partial [Bacteroidetes bacterium HGW-Bacteroidetes-22]
IPDFVKACHAAAIAPVAGVTVANGNRILYTLIARNNEGFRQINEFLTIHNLSVKRGRDEVAAPKAQYPVKPPRLGDAIVILPFPAGPPDALPEGQYIGVDGSNATRFFGSRWQGVADRLVAVQPVVFESVKGYELHRHLRAIDNNLLLTMLDPAMTASSLASFQSAANLQQTFHRTPALITRTSGLLAPCTFDLDFKTIKNKKVYSHSPSDDRQLLHRLAHEGGVRRYGTENREAVKRIDKELEMISQLGFASYFLIAWDMVTWSAAQGFFHVGRGSGANSVVAYCLGITDVDPISLDLYFERFINPLRSSPPDFDIDYSWKDRDAVQQYLFDRYGPRHTALLGAMSTFRDSSMYRELGKVYGLPVEEIDRLADHPDREARESSIAAAIVDVASRMIDFPNIRSIHAGGILITEDPITCYTALDMPPKGFATTQWDMYTAEAIGFEKLDVLSQRGIGHINDCVRLVRENSGIEVNIRDVESFKADETVNDLLHRGETMGCFYIESPAMRGLIRKLRCKDYLTLVAASSIIRPGVAKSGMMREYIWRFHNPGGFTYIHPVMKEQLAETYGVMVYQEDVLKVCHHFAGLDLADADILRRAMSGKFRGNKEMERIRQRFFEGCAGLARPVEVSEEGWRQIASFAGYSFSKAHSASYAVESYQSLYLKSRYPIEFMVAVINNFGGFYHTWVYFNEARRCGGQIELPCVNKGQHLTSVMGVSVYIGFIHVKGLETELAHRLTREREQGGEFRNLYDFMQRVSIGSEQITLLIRVGAFRFTGLTKAEL